MERVAGRTRFQGVWNIIRFNWPFYVFAAVVVGLLLVARAFAGAALALAIDLLLLAAVLPTLISLAVSLWVYDLSGFYKLGWLDGMTQEPGETIVNVNAGFDETSGLLAARFPEAVITAWDFYDPERHTAASIRRARSAYPPFPNTVKISTSVLPVGDLTANRIFAIMSAHEIRDSGERTRFFAELARALSPSGQIIVVEHLRDAANFMAYNIGAFHFHSRATWLDNFSEAGLNVDKEIKTTPFVTVFFLNKDGDPA